MVIHYGRERSAVIYIVSAILVYLVIAVIPVLTSLPFTLFITLATVPLAIKAGSIVCKHPNDLKHLAPALGMNVGFVLLTDLLLAIGLLF